MRLFKVFSKMHIYTSETLETNAFDSFVESCLFKKSKSLSKLTKNNSSVNQKTNVHRHGKLPAIKKV